MNELLHIIQREYLTRLKSTSFVIGTLATPLLLFLLILVPTYFASEQEDQKRMKIGLIDTTGSLQKAFDESELNITWLEDETLDAAKSLILKDHWNGVVYVTKPDSIGTTIQYYSTKEPSVSLLSQVKSAVQNAVVREKSAIYGIPDLDGLLRSARSSVSIESIKVGDKAETPSSPYQRPLCMLIGLIIYMIVLLFSSRVMRGVLEEKSNRIVEIIITSISPVKFMAGKIIGIALLGLTQIVCWVVILFGVSLLLTCFADLSSSASLSSLPNQRISQEDINQILNNLNQIDFNTIIPAFVFFFIGGYLLYSSIYAAIAATANHNDEVQQLTLIISLPLILSVIVLSNTINTPDSTLSYWFSIIPFTSPVVMMGRIVYGAPVQDILLSMLCLVVTVVITIWIAGKIYKMAILYTGKRITRKQLFSWIKNTNN